MKLVVDFLVFFGFFFKCKNDYSKRFFKYFGYGRSYSLPTPILRFVNTPSEAFYYSSKMTITLQISSMKYPLI